MPRLAGGMFVFEVRKFPQIPPYAVFLCTFPVVLPVKAEQIFSLLHTKLTRK
jgi:hypothetical protein